MPIPIEGKISVNAGIYGLLQKLQKVVVSDNGVRTPLEVRMSVIMNVTL